MRKLSLTLALAALVGAPAAFAQEAPTIYTGGDKGAYFKNFGPTIAQILGQNPGEELVESGIYGTPPELVFINYTLTNTQGTGENQQQVRANSGLNLGLGQLNLVAGDSEGLWFVDTGARECLFGISQGDTLTSAAALNRRVPFALPGELSGTTATFTSLEPFNAMRTIVNHDSTAATIAAVVNGDQPAGGFIQLPDTTNPNFTAAADLNFFGIINRDMLRQQVNGINVWFGVPDITVSPGSWTQILGSGDTAKTVTTGCTPVVVFGTDPALLTGHDAEDMTIIRDTLTAAAKAGLLVPDTGDWREMFAAMADSVQNGTAAVEAFLSEQMSN